MKKCNFPIEACFGMPMIYDNWFERLCIELTDEQFDRYCSILKKWITSEEWRKKDDLSGEDFFIRRDLPDIYELIMNKLKKEAPAIWDDRINDYIDQINIYTADEIWEAIYKGKDE